MSLCAKALVLLVVLSTPRSVWGQECGPQNYDSEDPPDFICPSPGEDMLTPRLNLMPSIAVERGETLEMPYDGALVARERLEVMGLRLVAVRRLRWLDRRQLLQRATIEQTAAERVHEAERQSLIAYRDHYRGLLDQRQADNKWFRSFWFGFIIGAVVALVLGGLAIYALSQLPTAG